MIVSEPFSVAYGLGRMSDVLVVDIGAGTTDLCRMHGTIPSDEDEISYTIAGDAIDQKLFELIQQRHPKAQVTQNMCKQIKEQYGFVTDASDKIEVMLPVSGKPTPHDLTNEIREACSILVPPIVDGIQKLVATFNPEFQERLRHNIVLSGGGRPDGRPEQARRGRPGEHRRREGDGLRGPALRRRQRRASARPGHAGGVLAAVAVSRSTGCARLTGTRRYRGAGFLVIARDRRIRLRSDSRAVTACRKPLQIYSHVRTNISIEIAPYILRLARAFSGIRIYPSA